MYTLFIVMFIDSADGSALTTNRQTFPSEEHCHHVAKSLAHNSTSGENEEVYANRFSPRGVIYTYCYKTKQTEE